MMLYFQKLSVKIKNIINWFLNFPDFDEFRHYNE